jgi:hypothetical protein
VFVWSGNAPALNQTKFTEVWLHRGLAPPWTGRQRGVGGIEVWASSRSGFPGALGSRRFGRGME